MPTPLDVATQIEDALTRQTGSSLLESLNANFSDVARLAERLGVDVPNSLSDWVDVVGASQVADWLDSTVSGFRLITLMTELQTQDPRIPLLGRLVHEEHLSSRVGVLAPYMRSSGLTVHLVLNKMRERVAFAAFDAAFQLTWTRRTLFSRVLHFARLYLEYSVDYYRQTATEPPRSFTARLGMNGILSARFSTPPKEDLVRSCEALLVAHAQGSNLALSYYLEGCTWIYDFYDDDSWLHKAVQLIRNGGKTDHNASSWCLNSADVWLRLLEQTASLEVRKVCVANSLQALEEFEALGNQRTEDQIRASMMKALLLEVGKKISDAQAKLGAKSVRFPFGLRGRNGALPDILFDNALAVIEALGNEAASGFINRDVKAELLSSVANDPRTTISSSLALLEQANACRSGVRTQRPLKGDRVQLSLAEDQLTLAARLRNGRRAESLRRDGIRYLVEPTDNISHWATKLAVLAREVELQGALGGALIEGASDSLALIVRNGDSASIYELAAEQAIRSQDFSRTSLGGRTGGVVSLSDSDRASGQIFVFKVMSAVAHTRDRKRTERLSQWITANDRTSLYSVSETLATLSASSLHLSNGDDGSIISIRRYSAGRTLSASLRTDYDGALESTVEFLALIHGMPQVELVCGVRKALWGVELGRWLRQLLSDEVRSDFFSRWWAAMEKAPMLERRDAHVMNWLVEASGKIVAVDLEASGYRPFAYELAQLIEDERVFDAHDWDSRYRVVVRYISELAKYAHEELPSLDEAFVLYKLAALARFVRTLSSKDADVASREWAGKCIEVLSSDVNRQVKDLAQVLAWAWAEKTGVASGVSKTVLSTADRRRISRAMSFRLRHDPLAPLSRDGWIHVEELTELLREGGHRVTAPQLMQIAGALGEARFELDGEDVRAAYGHSIFTKISYESRSAPAKLFHATPVENLASIFEAQSGLSRGRRQFVHLTDSREVALRASRRQGKPVVLLEIISEGVNGLVFAAGNTWLAEWVSVEQLRVAAVHSERDFDL